MPVTVGTVNVYQNIDLSLTNCGVPPVVHVRQHDHLARKVRCYLYANHLEYTIPNGATLVYAGTRPDGRVFAYSTEDSGNDKVEKESSNTVLIVITKYMTEVAGKYPVDLILMDGSDVLGSFNFCLSVESAATALV